MDEELTRYLRERYPHICFRKEWTVGGEMSYLLGQCKAIVESIRMLPLSPETRDDLMRVSLVKGAISTTAIEGNTLSEEEAEKIAANVELEEAPSREYMRNEVRNVIEALNGIMQSVLVAETEIRVSVEMILNFNRVVGHDLGDAFPSVPGQFRTHNVTVGHYRPPEYTHVRGLMEEYVRWLDHFDAGTEWEDMFCTTIIKAIAAHVYLAWIHPFGDGNGRTARLVEFFLVARAGVPNIASHILSNHYNQTRGEYYRQIIRAEKECDLTGFMLYALRGLLDGLRDISKPLIAEQLTNAWRELARDEIAQDRKLTKERAHRLHGVVYAASLFHPNRAEDLTVMNGDAAVRKEYAEKPRSVARDLNALVKYGLFFKENDMYVCNTEMLTLPAWRRRPKGVAR